MIDNKTTGQVAPILSSRYSRETILRAGKPKYRRRGAATIEFAVCLPVIILLVFGAIEGSSFIFLKQSLNVAAYEAVRQAIRNDSNSAESQQVANSILTARQVNDFQVNFPNGPAEAIQRGELVVVEVAAPTGSNSPLAGRFINNRTLTARVTMMKE